MPDPGYMDAKSWAKKVAQTRFDNLDEQVAATVYRATIGLPRNKRSDSSILSCDYVNQYSPIKFQAAPTQVKSIMDVIAGVWGFTTWPPKHAALATALLDLSDAYPASPVCLCTKFSSPAQIAAVFYDPDDVIRPLPSMRIRANAHNTAFAAVNITLLGTVLEAAKAHYREILPESIVYG